jgi:hypothetical protein
LPSTATTPRDNAVVLGVVWVLRSTLEPRTAAELGRALGADPTTLDRVLVAACRDGLVARVGAEYVAPTIRDLGPAIGGER